MTAAPKTEEKTAHTPGPWIASDVIKQRGKCYRTIRKEGRFKLAEVFAFNENAPPFLFGADGSREGKAAEEAKKLADLQHKGEQLPKTLRTPVEIFTDTLADLEEMINAGAISWETYNRAISKANEDLLKSLDTQKKINRAREKGFGAVTRGTVAAFSASQQSNREWNRLKQLQEDENRMAADRNRILNDIKANIVAAPPVAGI